MGLPGLDSRRIVVLPDLFIDAIVPVGAWDQAAGAMAAIASRGGGNLPVGPIELRVGGNAANLAVALARLGADVRLVAQTSPIGIRLLQEAAPELPLDHVRIGQAATTVSLESPEANVMLSHSGPVHDFGPASLGPSDWQAIADADAVAIVNWSQNRQGTPLIEAVAQHAPQAFLYLDTGDPRHRADALGLLDAPFWGRIGAWGLNENELRCFGGEGELVATAHALARRLGTRLDLHTRTMAASVDATTVQQVDADATPAVRLTGAGDAWNAGNLAGYLLGLPAPERLRLAHETATRHVTLA